MPPGKGDAAVENSETTAPLPVHPAAAASNQLETVVQLATENNQAETLTDIASTNQAGTLAQGSAMNDMNGLAIDAFVASEQADNLIETSCESHLLDMPNEDHRILDAAYPVMSASSTPAQVESITEQVATTEPVAISPSVNFTPPIIVAADQQDTEETTNSVETPATLGVVPLAAIITASTDQLIDVDDAIGAGESVALEEYTYMGEPVIVYESATVHIEPAVTVVEPVTDIEPVVEIEAFTIAPENNATVENLNMITAIFITDDEPVHGGPAALMSSISIGGLDSAIGGAQSGEDSASDEEQVNFEIALGISETVY